MMFALMLSLASLPMFATDCDYQHVFCGYLLKAIANPNGGWTTVPAPAGWNVYVTSADYKPTANTSCNSSGSNCDGWQAATFATPNSSCPINGSYQIFVTTLDHSYGQSNVPLRSDSYYDMCVNATGATVVPPAPLSPTITYPPENQYLFSATIKVVWNKATDQDRETPSWPVTYVVEGKSWPPGSTEPSGGYSTLYSGPCPAATGTQCSIENVPVPPGGYNFRIRVTAKMDVSQTVSPALRPAIFTNSAIAQYVVEPGRCCLTH